MSGKGGMSTKGEGTKTLSRGANANISLIGKRNIMMTAIVMTQTIEIGTTKEITSKKKSRVSSETNTITKLS